MKKPFVKALVATMIAAALFSCGNIADNPSQIQHDAAETPLNVVENGIRIRALANGVDDQNREYVDVGYMLNPADTTHVHFEISVTFKESGATGNPSSFVSAVINESTKTVRITKLADFSNVVVVTITDAIDSTKSASIEVHLKQKFLGWPGSLPADFNNNSARFQDSSNKYVETQSSRQWWHGLQFDAMSPHSYKGNGFSTTYTDAMTSAQKAVTVASVNVFHAKYYALSNATSRFNQVAAQGGYYSISSSGSNFIGPGCNDTQTINDVPEYGSLNPNFVLNPNSVEANLRAAIRIDTASWPNSQKAEIAAAEAIKLTVEGTLTLRIGTAESSDYPFTVDFYAMNSDYYDVISDYVPLSAIQPETGTVTF